MKKLLIAYYTWTNGNTERIAKTLQGVAGGDLLRIDTATPYPDDYDTVVDQGKREVERGFEPAIKPLGLDISSYDVIAVGTPTGWYTMAPAVKTFLHENAAALAGKTVVPFMTNGGWPGHVISDMEKMCSAAKVRCSLEVQFDSTGGPRLETPEAEVEAWAKSVCDLL